MVKKKRRRKVGDVFAIPLNVGFGYGVVCTSPFYAFYNLYSVTLLPIEAIIDAQIAFKVLAWDNSVKDGTWPVIANILLPPELEEEPLLFKKDSINGALSIYRDSTGTEVAATKKQCKNLECAAVWSPDHLVCRLEDLFSGRPNDSVERMQP